MSDSSAHKLRRLSGNLSNGSFGAENQATVPRNLEPQSSTSMHLFTAKGISSYSPDNKIKKHKLSKNKSHHGGVKMAGYSGGNGDVNSMGGLGFVGAGMIKATSSPRH